MPGGRYPWAVRAGGPLLGGGLPTLFEWNPGDGQALPIGATFTRPSSARYFDGSTWVSVGSNVIRDAHFASFGGARGFLCEPSATNVIEDSDDFLAASWTAQNLTLNNDGITPIGFTQFTLSEILSVAQHRIFHNAITATSVYCLAKTGTRNNSISRVGPSTIYTVADLNVGSITEQGTNVGSTIQHWGSGWYQPNFYAGTPQGANPVFNISNTGTPGTGDYAYLGDVAENILLCFYQAENTNFVTSPIDTSGTSGARLEDILDTGAVIASEFGVLLDLTLPVRIGGPITLIGSATAAQAILRVDINNNLIMDDGGTATIVATLTANTRVKISYGRDAIGRSCSLDGATAVTGDAPSAAHEGNDFELGSTAGVTQSRCTHHNSQIYSVRPTDAELEALSSP